MMDRAQIDSALRKIADTFLQDVRNSNRGVAETGWGQFVGQQGATQVGLYGTCAGVIAVSSAYGYERLPGGVVQYLTRIWAERNTAGSDGARYFALTTRLAFFFMALAYARHPALAITTAEADDALRSRLLNDGLFVSWEADSAHRSLIGDEFSTAIAILAYALTPRTGTEIPLQIRNAAQELQKHIEGVSPKNVGVRKLHLTAITSALTAGQLSRAVKRMTRQERPRPQDRDQDALYFWDYRYSAEGGMVSRRDYLVVPSDVLDILLASGSGAGAFQKLAALNLAQSDLQSVIDSGSFLAGRELAASINQAWMAIALSKSKTLLAADTYSNRLILRYFIGMPKNVIGCFAVPILILTIAAVSSAAPEHIIGFLRIVGVPMPAEKPWSTAISLFIQAAGLIVLPAFGESLGRRVWVYVRGLLA
jgi:hypothetical protein